MLTKTEMLNLVEKINDYRIADRQPSTKDSGWEEGTYYIGCMSAYRLTGKQKYFENAKDWADRNCWHFRVFGKPAVPKYYNNADNYTCVQTFLELLEIDPDCGSDEYFARDMKCALDDPESNHWKWTDLIYMGLPTMHMFAEKYNDERYIDKAYKMFMNLKVDRGCYDEEYHLWYRDEDYLPEKKLTPNGKKIFWGRGNGWAIGGIARGLATLPADNKYYKEYSKVFCEMAESLVKWQQPDGFWRCSIIDPEQYDVPETSGTVLITYALALGIKLGIIEKETYLPVVEKALQAMIDVCVDEDGRLGYVQRVAAAPGPVEKKDTQGYAVGALTLLCEILMDM